MVAVFDGSNAFPYEFAIHDHALVGADKVFELVDGNRPLTGLGLVITGFSLRLLVGSISGTAVERSCCRQINPLTTLNAKAVKSKNHCLGITDRHGPIDRFRTAEYLCLLVI